MRTDYFHCPDRGSFNYSAQFTGPYSDSDHLNTSWLVSEMVIFSHDVIMQHQYIPKWSLAVLWKEDQRAIYG